jgi:hypothetical protein
MQDINESLSVYYLKKYNNEKKYYNKDIGYKDNILYKILNSKVIYKYQKLIYDILIFEKVGIFGGFIRDFILRDHASKKFYDSLNNKIFDVKTIDQLYVNEYYDHETYEDRNITINDIDVVLTETQFENIKKKLQNNKFFCSFQTYNNINEYIPIYDKRIIKYTAIHITNKNCKTCSCENKMKKIFDNEIFQILNLHSNKFNEIKNMLNELEDDLPYFSFKIDAFIIENKNIYLLNEVIDSFTGKNSDFYCNSLRQIGNTISLNEELINKLTHNLQTNYVTNIFDATKNVFDQIISKTAKPILLPTNCRIEKMLNKNFKIIKSNFNILERVRNKETCIICRISLNRGEYALKLECCTATYHDKCLNKMYISNKRLNFRCPQCRKEHDLKEINHEMQQLIYY